MEPKGAISVWFFIGISLLVNGVLVFGAGLYELVHPPAHPPVLFQLHASVWWGALLAILGAVYSFQFSPGKRTAG